MNIIVSHAYSKENKGDAALLSVLLSDIQLAFDHPQVTILTLDEIQEGEKFEDVPIHHSFMYYARARYKNPLLQTMYAFFVAGSTLMWAIIYRATSWRLPLPKHLEEIVSLYENADLILPVGGGYILSKSGFINTVRLIFVLHPILFSYIIGKPTINYTQSIGPFGNWFQEVMARFTLKRVTGIVVRESISLDLLHKWGITHNVILSTDSGFSFSSEVEKYLREEIKIPRSQMLVGITVRSWFKKDDQERYEKAVAALADYIAMKYEATIVFIPQVTNQHHRDDDRESSQRVFMFMEHKERAMVMTERLDHHTIKTVYGEFDYLIGTRFHSVIFALTSYVPAIGIGYEPKTAGIMHDLGLDKWVIDIRTANEESLIRLFDELVKERAEYVNHLQKVLPLYIERARHTIFHVKEIYGATVDASSISGTPKLDRA